MFFAQLFSGEKEQEYGVGKVPVETIPSSIAQVFREKPRLATVYKASALLDYLSIPINMNVFQICPQPLNSAKNGHALRRVSRMGT